LKCTLGVSPTNARIVVFVVSVWCADPVVPPVGRKQPCER
jgi:hypothetical protein